MEVLQLTEQVYRKYKTINLKCNTFLTHVNMKGPIVL